MKSVTPVRVRFAPSPTGFLHIGGVRTALFNWLYARQHQGVFLLRIEDTDLERSEERFTKDILDNLKWLGFAWDEEPFYQSQRLEQYHQVAEQLIAAGQAYRCDCTEEAVEKMRQEALIAGTKPRYNGHCRSLSVQSSVPHVVRACLPQEGSIVFQDLIHGKIEVSNADLDDFVLIRSNGAPTYQLSVVVDDIASRITHVIRGDDHINNTPKQIHLYRFLKAVEPVFAHLPMILGSDRKKLSKRYGTVSASVYREQGYLPEAILNFLVRLGWSHGDQEVFLSDEMIQCFSFKNVQKSAAIFNEEKLIWLNGQHLRKASLERLLVLIQDPALVTWTEQQWRQIHSSSGLGLLGLLQKKVKTLKQLVEHLRELCALQGKSVAERSEAVQPALETWITLCESSLGASSCEVSWGESPSVLERGVTSEQLHQWAELASQQNGIAFGKLAQEIRTLLLGESLNLPLFECMGFLPWEFIRSRLK